MTTTQKALILRGSFPLGHVCVTSGANEALPFLEQMSALQRHAQGDWGDLDPDDWAENELALKEGFRLFSVYRSRQGVKFWIITEADRGATMILLPEEY